MIKKTFCRLFCVVLALVTVFASSSFSAFAAVKDEDIAVPYYTTIGTTSYGINISGITASCRASLSSKTSTTLKIVMELQKKGSSSYSTVKTWSDSRTGTALGVTGSKAINLLSTYRLKVTFTAGSEKVTYYDYP
ncbi:MAG: hypothetical protein ACLUFN_06570 [Eubacterium sp.]